MVTIQDLTRSVQKQCSFVLAILLMLELLFGTAVAFAVTEEVEQTPVEHTETSIVVSNEAEDQDMSESGAGPVGVAIIETGDAVAESTQAQVVNTTITDINQNSEDDEHATSTFEFATDQDEAEETPQASSSVEVTQSKNEEAGNGQWPGFAFGKKSTDELNASTTNEAIVETNSTTTAGTGNNSASGEVAIIETGEAYAVANVVNLVNTNILNSQGFIQFFNTLGVGSVDLRDLFSVFDPATSLSTPSCSVYVCSPHETTTTVHNSNNATVTNNVVVRSVTGGNSATGTDGAIIATGDAYAAANIFNVVNTNIVDSQYLLLSFNNIGSQTHDIVLPNADVFASLFGSSGGIQNGIYTNENTADIQNTIDVEAVTGNNTATGSDVLSGDAVALGHVENQVNQNFLGTDSFLLLIRVHGSWTGNVFGLPEGMAWSETASGIKIHTDAEVLENGSSTPSSLNLSNTNHASIQNNVSVYALTGENKIETETGEGLIETGDAYAHASIVNIANTNVLGQNWALLVFDIFGDWSGSVAFGRPDLWVATRAHTERQPVMPNDMVNYTFTIKNNGDTDATNVVLENRYRTEHLVFQDGQTNHEDSGNSVTRFNVGRIKAGEQKEFTYPATIGSTVPNNQQTSIELSAEVFGFENEDNYEDNSDVITVLAGIARSSGGSRSGGGGSSSRPANIVVEKSASLSETVAPATVDYTITIENLGGQLYNALLADTLENASGTVIHEETWDLGTVQKGEVIVVTYTTEFSSTTALGSYINYAQLVGTHRNSRLSQSDLYTSPTASSAIKIVDTPIPEVLGVAVSECQEYLSTYLRFGESNSYQEVQKLQSFLNSHMEMGLIVHGAFDGATREAVMDFQVRHRESILDPWNIPGPTGYVYLTTRKAINEIVCDGMVEFPLTSEQQAEIDQYRLVRAGAQSMVVSSNSTATADTLETPSVEENQEDTVENSESEAPSPLSDERPESATGVIETQSLPHRVRSWFQGWSLW